MSYVRTLNTTYEEVELSQIKTHPANPRRGDLDIIKQSISVNGFYGSVVVNRRTSHILAGNHRYLAAKDLGYETVPVTWVDVGEREEKRILAADNRTGELGGYDEALLSDLLDELGEADMLEGTGYNLDDVLPDDDDWAAALGDVPEGDRPELQQKSFLIHEDDIATVEEAIKRAQEMGPFDESKNTNSNGNALVRICEVFNGTS